MTEKLGVSVKPELLELALTHRSFAYEFGGLPTNERLEFLGDSVLGLVITEALYQRFPDLDESRLSPLRSGIVNMRALASIARELELGSALKIGKGEEVTGGRDKNSILADAFEALVGAIYLDHGFDVSAEIIMRLMKSAIDEAVTRGAGLDGKTALQEIVASAGWPPPEYKVSESGPDHDKDFVAYAIVNGITYPEGHGKSKREAEQVAARIAFESLSNK
ncbi:MAG: ribonuclease III [Actinobacteria bacterium]|nr:ribonuclease III [Actinomycetota bacterium]NBO06945.1 ribonuclease III [Actinomycetota bacterium]NBO47463.1 ribonuclease III [Actinomycetota bacterium]NBP12457.1 ribonuclease III [Actinomycetota bacterium]NBP22135.1 ribonuclease III [Actinomycetota bacterium]